MPGEPLPQHPSDLAGARPWYLRSFTTNPARVAFPIPSEPRLVVYWARWADAKGNVGKWSAVCQTRVEGWKPTPVLEYQPGEQRRQIAAGRGAGEGYLEEIEKKQLPGQTVTVKTLTREPAALPPPDAA
jgi:hypothetical protein